MADLFTPDDTVVLLIDHQDGTMSWVRSVAVDDVEADSLALPEAAQALDLPLVVTSSLEDQDRSPSLWRTIR